MNRQERRAALKRGKDGASFGLARKSLTVADLMAEARRAYRNGHITQAHDICQLVLARDPGHVDGFNLLGLLAQESGNHKLAIKMFGRAIECDPLNAACHYNLASSYQALDRRDEAATHFSKCLEVGIIDRDVETLILQSPIIAERVARISEQGVSPGKDAALFGSGDIATVTNDVLLRCAMESTTIRGAALELLLTHLRSGLLQLAAASSNSGAFDENFIAFFCGLARQCFINQYVFAQGETETRQAEKLRSLLQQRLAAADDIPAVLLIAVATYFPLLSVPAAETLMLREWQEPVVGLLRQQIVGPLQESEERKSIVALTEIEDRVSMQVMQQYEEHPYPRWTTYPLVLQAAYRENAALAAPKAGRRILIAGCGTGQHAFQTALGNPDAEILAIDISMPSLAYAQRKTREGGIRNIQYAQADVTKLGSIGRTFDRIEAVGVLHHLADPESGWRTLLSLLAPDGELFVGLYSELARRPIVKARALIAERGYRSTAEDIRTCRQEMMQNNADGRWGWLTTKADFYNMSGCRDSLFNVMEHRFTIPQIKAFLSEHQLAFLGFSFDVRREAQVFRRFTQQFPEPDAMLNLDHWHVFEAARPDTFSDMYLLTVCREQR